MKLSYSKPSHNILSYVSTANIEKVTKFYNLGDKTFETDFSSYTKTVLTLFLLKLKLVKLTYGMFYQLKQLIRKVSFHTIFTRP